MGSLKMHCTIFSNGLLSYSSRLFRRSRNAHTYTVCKGLGMNGGVIEYFIVFLKERLKEVVHGGVEGD